MSSDTLTAEIKLQRKTFNPDQSGGSCQTQEDSWEKTLPVRELMSCSVIGALTDPLTIKPAPARWISTMLTLEACLL